MNRIKKFYNEHEDRIILITNVIFITALGACGLGLWKYNRDVNKLRIEAATLTDVFRVLKGD